MLHRNCIKGYTLVELMIAIVIGLILIAGVGATYVAQNRSYIAQESVSEVNTQAKIAHDLIMKDVRGSGFGTPSDMSMNPIGGLTSIIVPVDSNTGTDAITMVGGFRTVGNVWPIGMGPGISCAENSTAKYIVIGATTFDISITGSLTPSPGDILTIDGIGFMTVLSFNGTTVTLSDGVSQSIGAEDIDGDGLCDIGRPIYALEGTTYCVDVTERLHKISGVANAATCTASAGSLDEVIADNIEDLQFAYAVDTTDDDSDALDTDMTGNVLFYNGGSVADFTTIRVARINVLASTDRPDPNYKDQGHPPATIENRNHNVIADDFRRRWWRTSVKMRNQ